MTRNANILVFGELRLGTTEVHLKLLKLVLEEGDDTDTAVDRVSEAHFRFIRKGSHGILALVGVEVVEELCHIARSEDLVDIDKLLGLVWREIGGKDTLWLALSAEELARCTGRDRRGRHPVVVDS